MNFMKKNIRPIHRRKKIKIAILQAMLHVSFDPFYPFFTQHTKLQYIQLMENIRGSATVFHNVEANTSRHDPQRWIGIHVAAAGSFVDDGTHGKSRDRVSLSVWLPLCGRSIPRNAHNAPFNMSRMLQRRNSILIPSDSLCTSPPECVNLVQVCGRLHDTNKSRRSGDTRDTRSSNIPI